MTIKTFQNYIIWQKSHQLVLELYQITKKFPPEERYGLAIQLRRSASSICANIAEGYRKSKKDFLRYLDISRGSLEETKYHIILSKDLNYISDVEFTNLNEQANEVGKILHGFSLKLRNS